MQHDDKKNNLTPLDTTAREETLTPEEIRAIIEKEAARTDPNRQRKSSPTCWNINWSWSDWFFCPPTKRNIINVPHSQDEKRPLLNHRHGKG